MSDQFVKVWRFADAPKEFQDLSQNGGDEDYLALLPKGLQGQDFAWLDCRHFGFCCIDKHELPNGDTIYIGSHS